ncbi:MAG: hypothetical protein O7I42_25865 [Alphaproteobacteria bacterium]|nr:hypothetical protein [Alphaproteobacteria bacterium]
MREDTVVQLRQPGTFSEEPLTEVLRLGARRLLAQAVEMEVTTFVEMHADLTDEAGRRRIVRLNSSCRRSMAFDVRKDFRCSGGSGHVRDGVGRAFCGSTAGG